jgi:hypothetical protein
MFAHDVLQAKSENAPIRSPDSWSKHVRAAILHVIGLPQFATAYLSPSVLCWSSSGPTHKHVQSDASVACSPFVETDIEAKTDASPKAGLHNVDAQQVRCRALRWLPDRFRQNRLTATQRSSLGMTKVVADHLGPANSGGERRLARTVAMEERARRSALGVGVCR